MNNLRERIEKKEKILGSLVCLTDPCLCEIMGNIGFDCVWVDMEHTYMSCKEIYNHLNAARSAQIPAVVRLPQNDLTTTKKVLEMGPDGIIFPMVTSAKELKELIDMTVYPPYGKRGFGPLRAIGWGAEDAKEYVDRKSFDLLRFVQIEHIDFIDDLEEILKVPYVDGFIFGPNDLSASLNDFLNVYDEKTQEKMRYATEYLKKHGKCVGVAGGLSEQDVKIWSSFGFDMLFLGSDWCYVYAKGKETLELMKKYNK